jgi:hypothetical protein
MTELTFRTTAQKLELFRSCFSGLKHVYGTYDPRTGRVRQVKEPVTDQVLLSHLQGQQPFGVYLLVEDRIGALAVDFDVDDPNLPLAFVAAAEALGLSAYIERSKSKGHHVWVFFEPPGALAANARRVVKLILERIGQPNVEIFPKQDRLDTARQYGNFINAPLFGRLVPQGRSVFLDPTSELSPYPDQWELLSGVRRVPEAALDDVLKTVVPAPVLAAPAQARSGGDAASRGYGLPPCARRMLACGVDRYQRVVCFRLAIHLKLVGIPQDLAVVLLKAWSTKNHPPAKQIITPSEIDEQVRDSYAKGYRSCGCEDPQIKRFCDSSCPLHQHREASQKSGATPAAMDGSGQSSENAPVSRPEKHAQPSDRSTVPDRHEGGGSNRVDHQRGGQPPAVEAKERS